MSYPGSPYYPPEYDYEEPTRWERVKGFLTRRHRHIAGRSWKLDVSFGRYWSVCLAWKLGREDNNGVCHYAHGVQSARGLRGRRWVRW